MMRNGFLILVITILTAPAVHADVFELPPEGHDVIGAISTVTSRHEDTLVDIARRHGLGYYDVVRANPDVNVWLPGDGTEIVLPSRFVLPPGPRKGLVLNLAEYRMYYFPEPEAGKPAYVYTYPISIGRMDWETPLGKTSIVSMVKNPAWYPPQSVRDEHAADGRAAGPEQPARCARDATRYSGLSHTWHEQACGRRHAGFTRLHTHVPGRHRVPV